MTYEAKRLYGRYVSVRDYIVKKAIDQAEDLIIWFEGKHMVVTLPTLESRIKRVSRPLQSKWKKDQEYTLMNFTWKPVVEIPGQEKLF